MDKKKLRAVPRETADDKMIADAANLPDAIGYMVTASVQDDILILGFFNTEKLRTGNRDAEFRTFHTLDDYITQDLKTKKTKWLTGGFENMSALEKYLASKNIMITFRSPKERKIVSDYFSTGREPWLAILSVQKEIRERRLKERHERELRETDEIMATVNPAPPEFFDWVWNTGMEYSQYLIYQGRYTANCECTACGQTGTASRKKIHMRHNEKGVCPFCGRPVTFKAKGVMAGQIFDERYFDYVEPTEDGFLFRVFCAQRRTYKKMAEYGRTEQNITEVRRAFYTETLSYKAFEMGYYKGGSDWRWCPNMEKQPCWVNVLYPGNLPEAWSHTPMKYSALELISKQMRNEDLICWHNRFPKLEWLIKMGLFRLVSELPDYFGSSRVLNLNGETIYDILKLGKENTKLLQALDGGSYELKILQAFEETKTRVTKEGFEEYCQVFDNDTSILGHQMASLHKICRYIKREAERSDLKTRSIARDWKEYVGWCQRLGYNLKDMHIYLPVNFKMVHDRVCREMEEAINRIEAEKRQKREADVVSRMKILKEEIKFDANDLVLVIPENGDAIRAEGEYLHNCLATYVDKVANGKCDIFFIRKADEPDKPYYALEWSNGRIVQCRGMNNCDMTQPVENFVQTFMANYPRL